MKWLETLLVALRLLPAVAETAVKVTEDVKEIERIAKGKK